MLLIVLLYIVCASMFTLSKWGLAYTEPLFFMGVRMILAGVLLGAYLLFKESQGGGNLRTMLKNVRHDSGLFIQVILFHIYFAFVFDLYALKYLSSIESAFLYNLSPFVTAFFSYILFREYLSPKKWLGLCLGLASLFPIFYGIDWQSLLGYSIPRLIMLLAVLSTSYGWVLVRALVQKGYSAIFVNSIGMFFGGLMALGTSRLFEPWTPFPVTLWTPFWQSVILTIIVANIIFYNLYGYLLKRYTATFLSFAGFLCPFFAAFLGYIFLNETVSPGLFISFIIVCFGLYLFYQDELKGEKKKVSL